MAQCERISFKKKTVCLGGMNHKIKLQTRSIKPVTDGVDFVEEFTQDISVWAMIKTMPKESIFDGSNIERSVSHFFYIRFIKNVTFEKWIEFKNNKYDIVAVENLNEEDNFLLLKASLRGNKDLNANLA